MIRAGITPMTDPLSDEVGNFAQFIDISADL